MARMVNLSANNVITHKKFYITRGESKVWLDIADRRGQFCARVRRYLKLF